MSNLYMSGSKTPHATRRNKQYGEGRICKKEDCNVVMSKYNKNKFCFAHAPISFGRNRGWIDPARKK